MVGLSPWVINGSIHLGLPLNSNRGLKHTPGKMIIDAVFKFQIVIGFQSASLTLVVIF